MSTLLVMPTSAREDYLKAVYFLTRRGAKRATTTGISKHLGVRKPSVTAMLKRLSEEGFVDYSPRQGVRLSEAGRVATMRVIRRHRLVELFLVEILGLDWSEVHDEAEVLEHHLSDRLVAAIDRVLGHPTEDPHGHPIPTDDASLERRELEALALIPTGARGTVRELRIEEAARLQRWKQLGLVPGARVAMTARQDLEDVMHIDVDGRVIVTGSEGVEGVFVELLK